MNIFVIFAITDMVGYGMEWEPEGWYCRGSRCWSDRKFEIHSMYTSPGKMEDVLCKLSTITKVEFADPDKPLDSPIDYRETTRFRSRMICQGDNLMEIIEGLVHSIHIETKAMC